MHQSNFLLLKYFNIAGLNILEMSLIVVLLISFPISSIASNFAMLELIEILHNKGSITDDEYSLLNNAAMADSEQVEVVRQDTRKEMETEIQTATESINAAEWASRVTLKGDVRLRYQGQDNDPGESRGRGRVRYRLGVIAHPAAGWEVGAGLASGSSDLRSTNQSFDSTFSSKGINLDYAYTQFRFNDQIRAVGGKFKFANYLYTASDLMWDSDINPEGFSVSYSHSSELGTTFANSGIWVLEENSSSSNDPHMIYAQLGQRFGNDSIFGSIAGTYYSFKDNIALGTNSNTPSGTFVSDGTNSEFKFDGVFSLSGELGVRDIFGSGIRTSLVADWVTNNDTTSSKDNGYLIGIKASQRPWSLAYYYADLEQNAWPDILPDSDRFDGLTGTRGHEIAFSYTLMRNVAIGVDYYFVKNDVLNEDQDLLQLDLNVRF